MATAGDVVRDALRHLKVIASGETPDADSMAEAIRALNLMVRSWNGSGVCLGWQDVSNPAETLPFPPEREEALGYLLATRLRAKYGLPLDPDVVALAGEGLAAIHADAQANDGARLDYDLPRASGNRLGDFFRDTP